MTISLFRGIQRRQSELYRAPDDSVAVVEDYAHHPTELAASLEVLFQRYPDRQITLIFQPHRYQRLRHCFKEFTKILSNKKLQVRVLPVFSAWENPPIDALENSDLAAAINRAGGNGEVISNDFSSEATFLADTVCAASQRVLIVLIGAGDICNLTGELVRLLRSRMK